MIVGEGAFALQRGHQGRILKVAIPVLYAVIFLVLILFAVLGDAHEQDAQYGSTRERFDSMVTVERMGTTYRYQETNITNDVLIVTEGDGQENGQAVLLVLLSADQKNQTITPIIVDPDTIVTIAENENSSAEKIQIGQAKAFPEEDMTDSNGAVWLLSQLFYGVPIDHYIVVDLDEISMLNDAMGGVTISLEADLTELDPEWIQGTTVSLNGERAKKFLCGQINGTDTSRTARQMVYLDHLRGNLLAHTDGKGYILKEMMKRDGSYGTNLRGYELLRALGRYENYEWETSITLPGEYHSGEDGEPEFWLDESETWEMIKDLWFQEEHTDKVSGSDK